MKHKKENIQKLIHRKKIYRNEDIIEITIFSCASFSINFVEVGVLQNSLYNNAFQQFGFFWRTGMEFLKLLHYVHPQYEIKRNTSV